MLILKFNFPGYTLELLFISCRLAATSLIMCYFVLLVVENLSCKITLMVNILFLIFFVDGFCDCLLAYPGDIWSGSEGGNIRVWPWESVEKSLSLSPEEKHMAALLVERSFIDLRSQVTINGVCNISSSDVKCLLSDHIRAKVWAAGSASFSLW